MAITRWDPFRDITTLQDRVNRLFGDSLARWSGPEEGTYGAWMPPVEIFEKEDNLVLRAELPGIAQKDIELHVENGTDLEANWRKTWRAIVQLADHRRKVLATTQPPFGEQLREIRRC